MAHSYPYPRPAVTVDTAVFAIRSGELSILLIRRKHEPFGGAWALPGGFVDEHEPLERAAQRELEEETGLSGLPVEQLGAFGDPGRDPRGHTVSVAFVTFVLAETHKVIAGDDAADAGWFALRKLPLSHVPGLADPLAKSPVKLAFDHGWVIAVARAWLAERLVSPLGFGRLDLVPTAFTLEELRRVHEAVLGRPIAPRAFRDRMVTSRILEPMDGASGGKRTKGLYRFRREWF